MAAARRIANASENQALALSLKYQLLSKCTNYLVIAEREAKAGELPELHQIPQMLAAGWGATSYELSAPLACKGSLACDDIDYDIPFGGDPAPLASAGKKRLIAPARVSYSRSDSDLPAFSRVSSRLSAGSPLIRVIPTPPRQFIERMEASVFLYTSEPKLPESIEDLISIGLEINLANEIKKLVAGGFQELGLVVAFLYALSESSISHFFERNLKRVILKRWKDIKPGEYFNQVMSNAVKNVTADDWGIEVSDDQLF